MRLRDIFGRVVEGCKGEPLAVNEPKSTATQPATFVNIVDFGPISVVLQSQVLPATADLPLVVFDESQIDLTSSGLMHVTSVTGR
jgi:hypothetical protein